MQIPSYGKRTITECSLSKKIGDNPADLPIPKKESINLDKKTKKQQDGHIKNLDIKKIKNLTNYIHKIKGA